MYIHSFCGLSFLHTSCLINLMGVAVFTWRFMCDVFLKSKQKGGSSAICFCTNEFHFNRFGGKEIDRTICLMFVKAHLTGLYGLLTSSSYVEYTLNILY